MELGSQIRRKRTERGLSQEDLAAAIYVSRQTVSNWENDKTYPDVQSLLLLSNLFGTSIDELVKGDVGAMEKILSEDAKKLNRLGVVMTVFIVLTFVSMPVSLSAFDSLFAVVPVLACWTPAMVAAVGAERLKRKHDLVTYSEVTAFCEGRDVQRVEEVHRRHRQHRALKAIALAIGAAIVGAIIGWCGTAGVDALVEALF